MSGKKLGKQTQTVEPKDYSPIISAEGDGLEDFRRVQQQYYNHANKIVRRRRDPKTDLLPEEYHEVVAWYRTQGDWIGEIIKS